MTRTIGSRPHRPRAPRTAFTSGRLVPFSDADAGCFPAFPAPASETRRILVLEPSPEVRRLLALAVAHAGYEAVLYETDGAPPPPDVETAIRPADVLLVEPAWTIALAFAREARRVRPTLPIVCASMCPCTPESASLEPDAFLLKPFRLAELQSALDTSVARAESTRPPRSAAPRTRLTTDRSLATR